MDTSIIGNNIDESSYVEIHQQETHISTETETCTTSNISSYPTDSEGKNFTNIPKVEGANEKDSSTNQPENGEGFDETLTKVIIDKDGIPRVSQTDLTENQAVEASPLSHEGNDDTVQTSVTTEVILTDEAYTENSQKAEDNCVPRETSVIENSLDESSLIATQQQETRVSADTDVLPTSYISGSPTVEGINEEDSEINLTDNGEGIDETLTKVIIDEEGYPHVSQTDLKGDQVVKDLPVSQEGDEEADTGTDIAVEEVTHLKVSAAESSMDVDHMASSEVSISIDNNTVEMSDGTNEINYQDDFEEEPNIMETPDQTNENDMPSTIPIENEPDYAVAAREELNEASNTLEYSNINHKNLTSDNAEATAESTYSEGSEKGDRSEAINEGEQLLPVKQELSPLEQLLQRNVTIDGDMSSIPEYEAKLTNLMKSMDDVLKHNLEILKMQSLKDFTADLGKFRGDMQTINDAFIKCSTMSENITYVLKELRQATEEVKSQILRKFHQEDLSSWIDNAVENDKAREMLQETIQAEERRCLAKAAEARHAAAVASTGVAQAQQLVAELEALAADADAQAKSAAAMAAAAVVAAEEARVAAVEKRRAEEEATRRAEEKARIKAEEEEKRKAEEEMKIAQEAARKGTDIEGERKTFMEEKAIKEAERKNPKNWPCYTYDGNGTDFKPSVACIIRAIEGSLRKTDVTCKCVDQSTGVLALGESEELVSNIIEIQQTDENLQLHFEESMSIAFPISLSRLPTGKETVIRKQGHDGVWRVLPASDTHFEDYKELKFVDCRSATFGVFAVIMRPKRDQLTFTRRGNKPTCSFDSRLFFLNRRGTVKHNVNVELEVNPLDMNLVPDLRARAPRECEDLLTASSIITLRAPPDFVLQKPLTVTVPLPQIQKRPTTSLAKEMRTADLRPLTARPSEPTEGDETESVHVLCRDIKGGWTILRDVNIISHTNKDVVNFDLMEFRERYILLRTKPDKRDAAVEKMATLVEQASLRRNVKIILRQRNTNILDVKVACAISNAAERTMKSLGEEGYTEGPTPSGDVSLREGQELFMRFRGNLECATKSPRLSLIFNSNIRAVTRFLVTEKDAYAQKGLNCYRGFVQVFTKALVPRPLVEGAAKNAVPEMVEAEILLTELLVELPKPEVTPPQPLATAPIFIKEGPMTNGVLRMLAGQLGNEWRELAAALSVPRMRIQAILRQHVNLDTADTRYDMLVTWAKRVPRSIDKVQVLSEALEGCGRKDLAEEVRQKGQRYKQQRFICARVSHLKQAFVKVAKANEVFGNWKVFAKKLGVRVDDIERIEARGGSGQEMCYSSLEAWQTTAGEDATITTLANHLRSDHQEKLSRDVESIGLMGALMS
ncbi:uncharacterized protein LOC127848310 [Dreissena polymorpha]|nr:uncharacterized protein LOC127848310 [Dreissena polymorpha]